MTAVDSAPQRPLYRVSALLTGLVRMWRAWAVVVPVIVANALLQGLLLLPGLTPALEPAFVAVAILSFLVLVASFCLVATALLEATTGPVDWRSVYRRSWRRFPPLLLWSLVLLVAVLLGLVLYIIPGFVILALFPYLLLAAVDGRSNPPVVNFRTIRARVGRWIVTVIGSAIILFVAWLFSLQDFFIAGSPAAVYEWLFQGFIASWLTCAWALVYRTANPPS